MTNFALRSLQVAVGAVALSIAGFATAQPAAAPEKAPVAKHANHKGHKRHPHHQGNPSDREAAAARQAEREGKLGGAYSDEQYARNAVARCQVFKDDTDKRACVDRIAKGQSSGSVEGGGVLREYSYTVPAN